MRNFAAMDGKMTIARAVVNDARILAQLSETTFRDAFGAQNRREDMDKYVAQVLSHDPIAAELADEANFFFLVWYNGRLAAYAKLRANGEPDVIATRPLEIERIYVLQQFHSQGIGAALMQHCIDFATAAGHDVVWLGVWEYNYRAVAFYRRCGFESCGSHPFLLGDDLQTDMLMRKVLC
jgi:ribosomal protein S18 acetylase RimI-like enzyme